jgi:hypothetical protein
MFTCPFCDAPAWRTRYMLWKHIHECLRKKQQYNPTAGINPEESAVVNIASQ